MILTPREVFEVIQRCNREPNTTEEDYNLSREVIESISAILRNPAAAMRNHFTMEYWPSTALGIRMSFTMTRGYLSPVASNLIIQELRDHAWPYVSIGQTYEGKQTHIHVTLSTHEVK